MRTALLPLLFIAACDAAPEPEPEPQPAGPITCFERHRCGDDVIEERRVVFLGCAVLSFVESQACEERRACPDEDGDGQSDGTAECEREDCELEESDDCAEE